MCIAVLCCASPSPSPANESAPPPGSQFADRKLGLVFAGRVSTPDERGVENALIEISLGIDGDPPDPCTDRARYPLTARSDREGRFAVRHDGPSRPRLPLCALVEVHAGDGQSVRSAQRVVRGLHDNPVGEHGEMDTVHVDLVLPQSGTLPVGAAVSNAATDTPASARTSSCRPADRHGRALVAELKRLVTATEPGVIAARDSFYHVPVVRPGAIALVTDAQTCSRAAAALTRFESSRSVAATAGGTTASQAAPRARTVIVAKVGTYWAVEDPDAAPNGRFLTVVLFDSRWKQVGGYTGP